MRKVVMTIEVEDVVCKKAQNYPVELGCAFARMVDSAIYNAVRTSGSEITLDEYIDTLCKMSDCIDEQEYFDALEHLLSLAVRLDDDVYEVTAAFLAGNPTMTEALLYYFCNEVLDSYVSDEEELVSVEDIFGTESGDEEPPEENELTTLLDKAYYMLKGLLNREVRADEKDEGNCHM